MGQGQRGAATRLRAEMTANGTVVRCAGSCLMRKRASWEVVEQSGGQNGAMSARSGDADWEQLKERDGPTFAATLRAKCSWTGRRQGKLLNHILSTEHTEMRRSCEVRPWV